MKRYVLQISEQQTVRLCVAKGTLCPVPQGIMPSPLVKSLVRDQPLCQNPRGPPPSPRLEASVCSLTSLRFEPRDAKVPRNAKVPAAGAATGTTDDDSFLELPTLPSYVGPRVRPGDEDAEAGDDFSSALSSGLSAGLSATKPSTSWAKHVMGTVMGTVPPSYWPPPPPETMAGVPAPPGSSLSTASGEEGSSDHVLLPQLQVALHS
mgnify:CR=1 FL=1